MKSRPFIRDVATTTVAQILAAALNAASLAVISRRLGTVDLGFYTLERRAAMLAQPLFLLGLTVATPRFISVARGRGSGEEYSYAVAGATLVAVAAGCCALVVLLAPRTAAQLLFGDADREDLARALAALIVATGLFLIVYSILRGFLSLAKANILEVVVVGLFPVVLGLVGPRDIATLIWVLSAATVAAVLASLVLTPRVFLRMRTAAAAWRVHVGELVRYGLARTPGDAALIAMLSLAPVVTVHVANAESAGYVSVVQSTVAIVAVVAGPMSLVLLPHAAREVGTGQRDARRYLLLASASVDLGLLLGGLVALASPLIIAAWLPDAPRVVVHAEQVAALGLPGYVVYVALRSYLDAVETRPISGIAAGAGLLTLVALLAFLLALTPLSPVLAAAAGLSAALTVTGALTFTLTARRLGPALNLRASAAAGACAVAMLVAGILLADAPLGGVALAVIGGALVTAVVMYRSAAPWIVAGRSRFARPLER